MIGIEVRNLFFSYEKASAGRSKDVLSDISFALSGDEAVGIIGANGAGKSTLLKVLVGLNLPYTGDVVVNGTPVKKGTLKQIREKTGYVFQDSDSQLFMSTVYEDVAFAPRNYGLSEDVVENRTLEALRAVHAEELKDKQIYRLSGGQKKLVSIATILSMQADIVLLDEPSATLDPGNRRRLIKTLNELKVLKIIASHDLDFIYDTCPRSILIANGRIARDGKTEDILKDRELLEKNGLELPLSFSRKNNN